MSLIKSIHQSALLFSRNRGKQRQFLWLIAAVCLLIFAYMLHQNTATFYYLPAAVAILFFVSLLWSKAVFPLLYIWMFFGKLLSEIISGIVLLVIFFFGIWPLKIFLKKDTPNAGWVKPENQSNFNEQF